MEIFNYDNRSLRLLNMLESNFLVQEKYLIDVLKVSAKTISNEIKSLNEIFETCAYIESKNSIFSLYIIKLEEYLERKRKIYEAGENFDSSKVRLVYIFKKLASSKESYLIDDLAFEMIVSRTTLNTDLRKLNDIIKEYNLIIKGKPNTGIKIVGSEKDIRIFILENIYNYVYKEDIFDKDDNDFFDKMFIKYKIDEQAKGEFLKYLTLSLDRFANGNNLDFEETLYDELLESYAKDFIIEVCNYVLRKYNIDLSTDEIKFLAICFATMRVPTKITKIRENLKYTEEYKKLVQEILEIIVYEYGLEFDTSDIIEEFIYHIYFLMERLKYGVRYNNNMKEKIKEQFPVSYKIAKTASTVIYDKYGYNVSEDEVSYLAIYFETFLKKIKVQTESLKVLLVTNSGPAFRKLMIKELENIVTNSEITTITTYENVVYDNFDLIISTVNKEFSTDVPVIFQNEILDSIYLRKEINFLRYVNKMSTPIIRGMESVLLSSISEHTFFKCDSTKTYRENLEIMIEKLYLESMIDSEFLSRIREREQKSSMIFAESVAFPHTVNKIENSLIIALGVSKDGFKDNKDLKLVFLACVPTNEERGLLLAKTYDELISIIKDKKLIEDISKIDDYNLLVNYFIKNTNLYR
ncbi:BglG family transcription antiterminator [Gemella cuniculi]|uniref:BglG family transcription antiterminator n=1 Tax=Gemella cuniculi TaxID=150240 RepID=UPI00040D8876|nr:PRD domain-containing protein [Gemella cuniculi]